MYFSGKWIDLSQPRVMGILNITPDSFFDGGAVYRNGKADLDLALYRAESMVVGGAAILDVGGESTRPGARSVSAEEQLDRIAPVIEAIISRLDVVISVDTSKPQVIEESVRLGAHMVNDVRALTEPYALDAAMRASVPICLMHMSGEPENMQIAPMYRSVTEDVKSFFLNRIAACLEAGIPKDRLIIDPGFGFGKSTDHNFNLLRNLSSFSDIGCPLLVGMSRKSMINSIISRNTSERLSASLGLAAFALERGASLIRTHDVLETNDVISMWMAVRNIDKDLPQT